MMLIASLGGQYSGFQINLLDTPGHQDFSEDTYRTLGESIPRRLATMPGVLMAHLTSCLVQRRRITASCW
jgi:hypothetical protein